MIRLKTLLTEDVKYQYGCIMAQIRPQDATKILDFNCRLIGEEMIFMEGDDYGREDDPHITVKYGLTESYSQQQIEQVLEGVKPFPIMVGRLDVFENDRFDVVKFNVDGKDLRRLREVFDKLPNEDKYPEYHPHMTLAYVKKGLGEKFKKRSVNKVARIMCDAIVYSDRGNKTQYPLC